MKKSIILVSIALVVVSALITGCAGAVKPPDTFVETNEVGWADVLVSSKVAEDSILVKVSEIVSRVGYEVDLVSKDTGYLRTKWKYTYYDGGDILRTRFTMQVSSDSTKVGIRAESQWKSNKNEDYWLVGYDTAKLKDMKDAIRGSIGT